MILIIADDFTGALDTSVNFAEKGFSVKVYIYTENFSFPAVKEIDVLVIDSETRHEPPKLAYQRVYQLVLDARRFKVDCFYKKTDSVLRGNIGSELSAMLDATEEKVLHFFPSFPDLNRVVKNGLLLIDGIPVNETPYGHDIYNPVPDACVANIISKQTNTCVYTTEHLSLTESKNQKKQINIYDALTNQDLTSYAEILLKTNGIKVFAGCMGFAKAIAEQIQASFPKPQRAEKKLHGYNKCIIICGSIHPVSKAQLSYAEAQGIRRVKLESILLSDKQIFKSTEVSTYSAQLYKKVTEEKYILIETDEKAKLPKSKADELCKRITYNLAVLAQELLDKDPQILPVIIGGDTLFAVFHTLGIQQISPLIDLGRGIVLSEIFYHGEKRHVVSKSGGFGSKDAVMHIINTCMEN